MLLVDGTFHGPLPCSLLLVNVHIWKEHNVVWSPKLALFLLFDTKNIQWLWGWSKCFLVYCVWKYVWEKAFDQWSTINKSMLYIFPRASKAVGPEQDLLSLTYSGKITDPTVLQYTFLYRDFSFWSRFFHVSSMLFFQLLWSLRVIKIDLKAKFGVVPS